MPPQCSGPARKPDGGYDRNDRTFTLKNSWGEDNGQKGFYLMNDSWFDEYLFEIAARQSYLPATLRAALAEDPIVLPAWDPMGSLAQDI